MQRPASPSAPLDITSKAGAPETSAGAAPSGQAVLIDAKIGDINGFPVWASEFFNEQLSARLRADAAKKPRRDWIEATRRIIDERLNAWIDDRLMKDEGLATLTPEMQRFGLQAIVNQWRDTQKSKNLGSESLANQSARENQTQYYAGLDEQAKEYRDQVLIWIIKDRLDKSISIGAADVRRFYTANKELFDPPPAAVFSMIVIPRAAPQDAETVRWALEQGAAFADVASLPLNAYKPDSAGRVDKKTFTGDYAQAEFFGPPALTAAARTLRPGEWTGPFDDGRGNSAFLRLDEIITNTISLYDAQMAIDSMLHSAEFQARMRQKIDKLKTRSSLTDQSEMSRRLLDFAIAKFLPPAT